MENIWIKTLEYDLFNFRFTIYDFRLKNLITNQVAWQFAICNLYERISGYVLNRGCALSQPRFIVSEQMNEFYLFRLPIGSEAFLMQGNVRIRRNIVFRR